MSSTLRSLERMLSTIFSHCVDLPLRSSPSTRMKAPLPAFGDMTPVPAAAGKPARAPKADENAEFRSSAPLPALRARVRALVVMAAGEARCGVCSVGVCSKIDTFRRMADEEEPYPFPSSRTPYVSRAAATLGSSPSFSSFSSAYRRKRVAPPPLRFGMVEDGIFRSGHPTLLNHRYLRRLKLRTIVAIVPESPLLDMVEFCGEEIELIALRAEKYKEEREGITLTPSQVAKALSILIDPSRHPVLLHCLDGCVLTGVVVMCLRKLQGWTWDAMESEALRYRVGRLWDPKGGSSEVEVKKFVRDFSDEVVVPETVPSWLWQGQRGHSHQHIRIRHDPPLEPSRGDGRRGGERDWPVTHQRFEQARNDNIRWRQAPSSREMLGAGRNPSSLHFASVGGASSSQMQTSDRPPSTKAMMPMRPLLSRTMQALALEGLLDDNN
jgi:tyrosine-protein phosphatase OCA6